MKGSYWPPKDIDLTCKDVRREAKQTTTHFLAVRGEMSMEVIRFESWLRLVTQTWILHDRLGREENGATLKVKYMEWNFIFEM